MAVKDTHSSSSADHPAGCLLRLFWMMFGNVALALAALLIVRDGAGLALNWPDAMYGAALAALLVARYLDVHRFAGQTSDGIPATPAHFRRYALLLVAGSTALWVAVHALAHLRQG